MRNLLAFILIYAVLAYSQGVGGKAGFGGKAGIGGGATAGSAYVQKDQGQLSTGTSVTSTGFGLTTTTGDALIGLTTWPSITNTISSVTYSGGSSCAVIGSPVQNSAASAQGQMFHCDNITGASAGATVTVNYSGSNTGGSGNTMVVHEVSGVTSTPIDQSPAVLASGFKGSGATLSANSATSTHNGEYIFAALIDTSGNGDTFTAGAGFTIRWAITTNFDGGTEDQIQATAGAITATFTSNTNFNGLVGVATLH